MRDRFTAELELLNQRMIRAENLCLSMLEKSRNWLMETDQDDLYSSQRLVYVQVRDLIGLIDRSCMQLLLKEQPVARDLRMINLTSRVSADLMRIAKLSLDFSRQCEEPGIEQLKTPLIRMSLLSEDVLKTVFKSRREFSKIDASGIDELDDQVDQAFDQLRNQVTDHDQKKTISRDEAINVLMAAKCLERIADHAVRMAKSIEMHAD